MLRKRIVSYGLTILLFAIFSLPIGFVALYPRWLTLVRLDIEESLPTDHFDWYYLGLAMFFMSMISPWALLLIAAVCHSKGLRTRTYVATGLFVWAAATMMLYVFMWFSFQQSGNYIPIPWYGI